MAWCFQDEANEYAMATLAAVEKTGAIAPTIWPIEVANVLVTAERRGRLTVAVSERFLRDLRRLDLLIDAEASNRAWQDSISLARAYKLTAYDAAYLELAIRHSAPLATLDIDLRDAAKSTGTALITL